ncbi:MAG TPA: LysR family transcriptional regulator [Opitutaceae bacterium]|jgi:molybdate transport system regulatory protein
MPASTAKAFESRLRLLSADRLVFGPGKADLLERIAELGSIRRAASKMGMSYNRAWQLVRSMNADFCEPLVARERGGVDGGGAALTPVGQEVMRRYRKMVAASERAAAGEWARLSKLIH